MRVGAQQSNIKGFSVARDADGNPKLRKEQAVKFWSRLNIEDKEYLNNKYSLDLEIK